MKKIILAILIAICFSGCAITLTSVVAFTSGALVVAENVGDIAKTYKVTKEYLFSDNNATK